MVLFGVCGVFAVVGLCVVLFQIVAVRRHFSGSMTADGSVKTSDDAVGCTSEVNGPSMSATTPFRPPISVLKPLKGLDDNLFDNLESFCRQDYPEYEIIFSLQDEDDPACRIASKIKDKYPQRKITIIVEQNDVGLNPKVNNLCTAYRTARFPYVLISDSNVMVDPSYLQESIRYLEDPDVGMVTHLIRGVGSRSIGASIENLHLNTFVIGNLCLIKRVVKRPCVVGKSMLMRRDDLDGIGGFHAVKDVLAEDYVLGVKMQERGKNVVTSACVIDTVNQYWTVRKFVSRHARWGKIRWTLGGARYLAEIATNAVFWACLPVVVTSPTRLTVSFAMAVGLCKIVGDYLLGRRIGSAQRLRYYFLAPLKDIIVGLIWFVPLVSTHVTWRGNSYRVGKGSLLLPQPIRGGTESYFPAPTYPVAE
jgi:ceramide glucosyltransferase